MVAVAKHTSVDATVAAFLSELGWYFRDKIRTRGKSLNTAEIVDYRPRTKIGSFRLLPSHPTNIVHFECHKQRVCPISFQF